MQARVTAYQFAENHLGTIIQKHHGKVEVDSLREVQNLVYHGEFDDSVFCLEIRELRQGRGPEDYRLGPVLTSRVRYPGGKWGAWVEPSASSL
jgi:hypothetical protein